MDALEGIFTRKSTRKFLDKPMGMHMKTEDYLKILVEEIHSAMVATIADDGHPQTRVIDMMLYDEDGVYFLTAKGKAFYAQLTDQGLIALSATRDKISDP